MLSTAMVLLLAALCVAVGTFCGWLLRGRVQKQTFGRDENDGINADRVEIANCAAHRDPQTSGFVARPGDTAATIKPVLRGSIPVAEVNDPIANEAAAPCVRNTFSLALSHRLAESARRGDPLSVILVRIDNYEGLGNRYGLEMGNQFLESVGRFFIASVRGMDWVARFDTTTFAILLPNTTQANALRVAERLRTTVSSAAAHRDGSSIPLTLSLGTAEAMGGDGSAALLRRAEEAMNASIQTGGNRIHSYADGRLERESWPVAKP